MKYFSYHAICKSDKYMNNIRMNLTFGRDLTEDEYNNLLKSKLTVEVNGEYNDDTFLISNLYMCNLFYKQIKFSEYSFPIFLCEQIKNVNRVCVSITCELDSNIYTSSNLSYDEDEYYIEEEKREIIEQRGFCYHTVNTFDYEFYLVVLDNRYESIDIDKIYLNKKICSCYRYPKCEVYSYKPVIINEDKYFVDVFMGYNIVCIFENINIKSKQDLLHKLPYETDFPEKKLNNLLIWFSLLSNTNKLLDYSVLTICSYKN